MQRCKFLCIVYCSRSCQLKRFSSTSNYSSCYLTSYTKKAEELKAVSLASAMETVEKLEIKLADFAKKHKHDIQHDPAFRSNFLECCAPLGESVA